MRVCACMCVWVIFYYLFLGMCKLLQRLGLVSDLYWRRSVNVLYERGGRRQSEVISSVFFFFFELLSCFYFLCVYGTPYWKLPSGGAFVILDHEFVLRDIVGY